jgi:hypothetical protein
MGPNSGNFEVGDPMLTNNQDPKELEPEGDLPDLNQSARASNETPAPVTSIHKGVLNAFFETGTEGLIWALEEDGNRGWDGLHFLKEGDHLRVTSPDGAVLFDGTIVPDRDVGKQPRFPGSPWEQPVALGCWVHWTQNGWTPDDWASLFVSEVNRAVLTRGVEATS